MVEHYEEKEFTKILLLSETDMPDWRPIEDLDMLHGRPIGRPTCLIDNPSDMACSDTDMPGRRLTYKPNWRHIGD